MIGRCSSTNQPKTWAKYQWFETGLHATGMLAKKEQISQHKKFKGNSLQQTTVLRKVKSPFFKKNSI
jgi:hypothetical protein